MAARNPALDWNKVKAILSPEDFAVVSQQRARHLELNRILTTPVPKIDFSQYKSILSNQNVVEQVQQALTGFQPVKADSAPVLKSLDEQEVVAVRPCIFYFYSPTFLYSYSENRKFHV
jgi:hypothetical protein